MDEITPTSSNEGRGSREATESPINGKGHTRSRSQDQHRHRQSIEPDKLHYWDVASFNINKMVGTGIFTTPGTILLLVGSKKAALVIWPIGWLYACIGTIIYIEYGIALPFTGAELIYLDEVWEKPELLMTCIFSSFFLLLGNVAGNSLSFARFVILSFESTKNSTKNIKIDSRLQKFAAIFILSVVCLLNYFSTTSGRWLNKIISSYKIALLVVFFLAGFSTMHSARDKSEGMKDFNVTHESSFSDYAAAFLLVVYSFRGWENANYISSEIHEESKSLKVGGLLAVSLVGICYQLVNAAFMIVCTYEELTGDDFINAFTKKTFGDENFSSSGCNILIAISAFGSLVAISYTTARVKREIARQQIMPWYKFWGSDSHFGAPKKVAGAGDINYETAKNSPGDETLTIQPSKETTGTPPSDGVLHTDKIPPAVGTPTGGLILTWAVTLILICATPAENGKISSKGFSFIISMFVYGQAFISVMVGCGLPIKLPKRLTASGRYGDTFHFVFLKRPLVRWVVVVAYIAFTVTLILFPPFPPDNYKVAKDMYPGYWLLVASASVFAIGILWWLGLTYGLKHLGIDYNISSGNMNGGRVITYTARNKRANLIMKYAGGNSEWRKF